MQVAVASVIGRVVGVEFQLFKDAALNSAGTTAHRYASPGGLSGLVRRATQGT
jgi:hypothetical protein